MLSLATNQAGDRPASRSVGVPGEGMVSETEPPRGRGPEALTLHVGVILRRQPGATRWAKWAWRATAVLPGAGPADWRLLRRDGDATEHHAATMPLELHRADAPAYREALAMAQPAVWTVLRFDPDAPSPAAPEGAPEVHLLTASPYEAQDYMDSGEEQVDAIAAPPALLEAIEAFTAACAPEETFKKRRRDRVRTDRVESGIGDPRVRQTADVYRAPGALKRDKR